MENKIISDEYLNSFVDNQLESSEKNQVFDAINQDESLKERVCELRRLKELMQHAYGQPSLHTQKPAMQMYRRTNRFQAIAACLLLSIGGVSGWITHAWISRSHSLDLSTMVHAKQGGDAVTDTRKIIVQISHSDPARLKAALDETEGLLDAYRRINQQILVEVIANKRAVDLLRTNVSIHTARINMMQQKYPNLNFMVCGQTISKLREKGENVQLLPQIKITSSAAEQISKRLHQGWGYVKI